MTKRPLVVVLGASGYLGSVVTALLARKPVRLRAVGRRPCPVPTAGTEAEVESVQLDLTDRAQLVAAVAGADAVLHLVKHRGDWRDTGRDAEASARVNVGTVRDLLDTFAAADRSTGKAPLVLLAAASSQIGRPPPGRMSGREPDRPETEYDRQKLAAEQLLEAATAAGAIRGISLRVVTAVGHSPLSPVPDTGVVTTMIRRALDDQPLTLWNDGTVLRDFTYVEDMAAAFVAALDRPDDLIGRHWLVSAGHERPLGDVFRTIASCVSARTGRDPVPVLSVPAPASAQPTDFWSVAVDTTPFHDACGWSAQVSLAGAVDRTVTSLLGSKTRETIP